MTIREFTTTGDAYDACQCDETIKNGDVLVIKREHVVGVAWTWPFAVTKQFGVLHTLTNALAAPGQDDPDDGPALQAGLAAARAHAAKLGYELQQEGK